MKRRVGWVLIILAVCILGAGTLWWFWQDGFPVQQGDLSSPRIYAYRDWQSLGIQLNPGDVIRLRAHGTWLYTPGEYHGPEGHHKYPSPNTYPINGTPGGILIGRFGDNGAPFIVGRGGTFVADAGGLLYLRINDDILTDNEGYVTIEVSVTPSEMAQP